MTGHNKPTTLQRQLASIGANRDSWFASPEYDAEFRRRRIRERSQHRRRVKRLNLPGLGGERPEVIADPEGVSSFARRRAEAYADYFSPEVRPKRPRGDSAMSLPESNDLHSLADAFGASPERLAQAVEMQRRGLRRKAKRQVLCGRIGHRVNCSENEAHRFFQPYGCRCRYCEACGPAWFREKFSELVAMLEPVVEHLLDEGRKRGRQIVIAKIDFTVPNTHAMPTPKAVRKFHKEMHDFWYWLRKLTGLRSWQYGVGGCDEFGGSNTNLHRHSVYVGPILPQRRKELSALWSIVALQPKRKREMLKLAKKYGLRDLWRWLDAHEQRFVSIKRAGSFRGALAHALKYPAKFLADSTPERLAELEATFHKTRRFSTGGAFYRVKSMREPGEDSPIGSCPHCGARLCEVVEPWVSRFALESEGRKDIGQVRRELLRAKVLSGSGPP